MSFTMPSLIVESLIRDGLEDIKVNPTILDSVFEQLNSNYAQRKYGSGEITKIKDLITGANKTEIAIVYSYYEAEAKVPSISLQLGHTSENIPHAHISDFEDEFDLSLTSAELAALIKITGMTPTAFDSVTGKVSVLDSVDLSLISTGFLYADGSQNDHIIRAGISNETGNKFFFVTSTPDIASAGTIRSPLTTKIEEERGVLNNIQILIGIHTKSPLLTIYLFTLVQFFLLSRKADMINRGIINSTLSGSDFNRDVDYKGDRSYTRFITLAGEVENSWKSTQVNLVDTVDITGNVIL